ncbi:hypothetical protein [Nonomuraea dietziae]
MLRDPLGLRVGLHVRVASEVVERWVSLTNEASTPSGWAGSTRAAG